MSSLRKYKGKDGKTIYYARYRYHGRRQEISLGKITKKQALDVLSQIDYAILMDTNPIEVRKGRLKRGDKPVSIQNAWNGYIDHLISNDLNSTKTLLSKEQVFSTLPARVTDLPIKIVRVEDLESWFSQYRIGKASATANRAIRYLRHFFNYCIERNLCKSDPTKLIPKIPEHKKVRSRALSDEQISYLMEHTDNNSRFYRALVLGIYFGLRSVEIINLKCSEIDLESKSLMVTSQMSKTNTQRIVPAPSDEVFSIVEEWKKEDHWLVVPYQMYDSMSKQFAKVRDENGWSKDLTFRSTRHSYIIRLLNQGVPQALVARLAGHSTPTTTDKYYSIFGAADLRKAVSNLS
ncbi:MAG TPA: site-specific integrase [Bacteroidetes bacterium]|nr:tyrosine recombinase XerD [bacterium BMS3Bbin04]HDO64708.1 site-specific integrase [Bacteroidota bacterium]HEX03833.1 site-specific integrase [Bacteroidota bacterium]